jgi:ABC-type glycerol-3-phosphate transport system substrate-binding protein
MAGKIKIIVSFLAISSLFFLSGCKSKNQSYRVDLEIWGLFDDNDDYAKIIEKYRSINPYAGEIKFKKLDEENYRREVIDAMAAGQGPDIFFIHNTWLPSFKDKIEPAPGWIINEQEFKNLFVDVAANDFLENGKIYAVPASVDSLALFYNKDLFNAEGITSPPATWEELVSFAKKLKRIDQYGNIIQQGAALGTAYNINRSTDILGLITMQKGAQMVDDEKRKVIFDQPVFRGNETVFPAIGALEFYTHFADSRYPEYSWNPRMHYSIDAFYEGTAAMMLNYSWHYSSVQSKNNKLNFAVAPVPQFRGTAPINYANYWAYAVSKNKASTPVAGSQNPPVSNEVRVHEAWQFLKFLTGKLNGSMRLTNGNKFLDCYSQGKSNCLEDSSQVFPVDIDPAQMYLQSTGKPAARRDLVEIQKSDVVLGPFAYGNLIAKSWYQVDPEVTETTLAEAINSVNFGLASPRSALELAANRINQFMREKNY